MFKIDGSTIKVTRGDIGAIKINVKNESQTDYTFQEGDVVRFKVFKNKDCSCVELEKDVEVETEATEIEIELTKEDTKIGELISKPITYWYEIELNPDTEPQTIIGYDDKGAKLFILYPEGGDQK